MKSVDYQHSWSSDKNEEQEMAEKFGKLLHSTDTADSYEVAESHLYKKGTKYYWLQADGCSCWDGDYTGYELTKPELMKLAKARAGDEDSYRGAYHDKLMGIWVVKNLGKKI